MVLLARMPLDQEVSKGFVEAEKQFLAQAEPMSFSDIAAHVVDACKEIGLEVTVHTINYRNQDYGIVRLSELPVPKVKSIYDQDPRRDIAYIERQEYKPFQDLEEIRKMSEALYKRCLEMPNRPQFRRNSVELSSKLLKSGQYQKLKEALEQRGLYAEKSQVGAPVELVIGDDDPRLRVAHRRLARER